MVILADAASRSDRLLRVSNQVSQAIEQLVQPLEEWGVLPYFNFRSQSERRPNSINRPWPSAWRFPTIRSSWPKSSPICILRVGGRQWPARSEGQSEADRDTERGRLHFSGSNRSAAEFMQ